MRVKGPTLNEMKFEHKFISEGIYQLTDQFCKDELNPTHILRLNVTA